MLRASTSTVEARVHAWEICAWAMAGSAHTTRTEATVAAAARPSAGNGWRRLVALMRGGSRSSWLQIQREDDGSAALGRGRVVNRNAHFVPAPRDELNVICP